MKKVLLAICMLSMGGLAWAQTAPPLASASAFAVLSAAPAAAGAVTCTNSTITGSVGSSGLPAAVVRTTCPISGAIIAPVAAQVLTDFNAAYDALTATSCDMTLTGNLAGVTLPPGVYCFPAAATVTGTLTLLGPSTGIWIFKIGTGGTGALTGTGFSVVLANGGQPCNVFWWVAQAATMTNSNFVGTILAGAAITSTGGPTGGTFVGRAMAKAGVTLTGTTVTDNCLGQSMGGGGDDDDHRGCKTDDDDHDKNKDHHDKDKDHPDKDHKD
jgi:Ice-binding-like